MSKPKTIFERLDAYQKRLVNAPIGELMILEEAIKQEYLRRGY